MPSTSLETLVATEFRLNHDAEYVEAGRAFLNASAAQPPFVRIESSLMVAFEGRPQLKAPPAAAEHKPRMFELRTYESPTIQDHVRKVEMFNSGEFEVFEKAGFWPVFDATRWSDLDCPTSPTCSALMTWRIALRSGMRFARPRNGRSSPLHRGTPSRSLSPTSPTRS